MLRIVLLVALLVALFYAALWLFQDKLIYFPRRYGFAPEAAPVPFERITYLTAEGPQTAFYMKPPGGIRTRLWLVFGGNAMTALDWADWAHGHREPGTAFLLLDYPGYGFNQGAPSRASIAAASDAAFVALADHLKVEPAVLARETALLGHSLGAAVALEFATRHRPQALVLTAPFTRLRDVAARFYGPWIKPIVREDYDSVARLAELGREPLPTVILHGRDDEVIAFDFGQSLAASAPWVRFVPIEGARHNDIYAHSPELIRAAMREVVAR